ncbi:glutathione-independent glyoxalase DJR-1.1-like isoform X2 [Physella acuta]|uniref:glutathione-independent glyoxalase DJR-1.1-like isoform X2 n=1 Tax=Physella acuta TaxID=109671 RepID=UPI0027DB2B58|nr:glutathione-independent glyoxalase DJR-1.1-like isoform X2 [Physella acuta]
MLRISRCTQYIAFPLIKKLLHTVQTKMPSALVFLAEGAEEMETVITVDILRRCEIDVVLAGLHGNSPVNCSRNVKLVPDMSLKDALAAKQYDILICPGGGTGAENLCKSKEVGEALKDQEKKGGYVAAVCAAPTAFLAHGIGKGKKLTSYPSFADKLKGDYKYSEDRVVVDGKMITSRGPGTCFEFALAIVEQLKGKEKAQSLIKPLLLKI